jgi:hypothetical protein
MPQFNTKDVTTPNDGLVVYKNAHWLCVNGDPKQALFFGSAPQCNTNIKVQEWAMKQDMYAKRGDLQIVFIETAFVPQRN